MFQGQITSKTKLETTETYTKKVEQKLNRNHPHLRVDLQEVSIPASPTPKRRRKAKPVTPPPPHHILL